MVVWSSFDALGSGFGRVTDSKGNTYTLIGNLAHGSVGAGLIAISQLDTQLETTDTITHTWTSGSNVAKGISAWEYSLGAGKRWAQISFTSFATLAADPGAITLGSLPSREWLMLHLLAAEAPSTDAYTWDADYTQIVAAGTTGGVADTNMTTLGGFRIATLTTDTVDVTSTTADRDYIQVLVAIEETTPYGSFPLTPIVDDFNRANEDPMDDGQWSTATCIPGGGRKLRVVSNQSAISAIGGGGGPSGQWQLSQVAGPNSEVYVTMAVGPSVNLDALGVLIGVNCGNDSTLSGRQAYWQKNTTEGDYIYFARAGFGGGPSADLRCWLVPAAGSKLGLQIKGDFLHLWVDTGSGWVWRACKDFQGETLTALPGLQMVGSVIRAEDFGCGDIPPEVPDLHLLPLLHVGT